MNLNDTCKCGDKLLVAQYCNPFSIYGFVILQFENSIQCTSKELNYLLLKLMFQFEPDFMHFVLQVFCYYTWFLLFMTSMKMSSTTMPGRQLTWLTFNTRNLMMLFCRGFQGRRPRRRKYCRFWDLFFSDVREGVFECIQSR